MTARIRFAQSMPSEVRAALGGLLGKWAGLVPTWCHELNVRWNDRDADEGALSVTVYHEYRNADLDVHANFLTNAEHREEQLVHELMHLSLAPLTAVAEAMRDALVQQAPDVEAWANEMLRQGEEATTCDLAELVLRRAT